MQEDLKLELVSRSPRVAKSSRVLEPEALPHLVTRLSDRHWLAGQWIPVRQDLTGTSFEVPPSLLPAFERVRRQLRQRFGMNTADVRSVRIRDYRQGNGHPPHCDHYTLEGKLLLQTALWYLSTSGVGR